MLIIPSILTNDPNGARELLEKAEEAEVKRVQIDIVDGKFTANKTIDPVLFQNTETSILFDYHLMVEEPLHWVEKCVHGGADRIIGQVEKMSDQLEFVAKVQSTGAKVGIGVDLPTSIETIIQEVAKDLDVVLIMSVPAGFGGQKFHPEALQKVRKLNQLREKEQLPFKICVDGGITKELIPELEKAGVDEVSIGRRFFEEFI